MAGWGILIALRRKQLMGGREDEQKEI